MTLWLHPNIFTENCSSFFVHWSGNYMPVNSASIWATDEPIRQNQEKQSGKSMSSKHLDAAYVLSHFLLSFIFLLSRSKHKRLSCSFSQNTSDFCLMLCVSTEWCNAIKTGFSLTWIACIVIAVVMCRRQENMMHVIMERQARTWQRPPFREVILLNDLIKILWMQNFQRTPATFDELCNAMASCAYFRMVDETSGVRKTTVHRFFMCFCFSFTKSEKPLRFFFSFKCCHSFFPLQFKIPH